MPTNDIATAHPVADVILIGAGIMSATLGMMLKELDPNLTVAIYERLDVAAAESSDAWNNAGTGHSAFCELNYTPERPDGSIDISKALKIAEQFEESKQFWAFLAERYEVKEISRFINHIPHMSFVWGQDNVEYLRKRHQALTKSALFEGMEFSEDRELLQSWIPLVMEGRDPAQPVAATRMDLGTDVNFGSLTRGMFTLLQAKPGVTLHFNHEVQKLKQKEGVWRIQAKNLATGEVSKVRAKFVFIGAGGGSLPLLEKSGIPEADGFGGFPVSGQWLKCTNPAVIARHEAKVYGKASVGSPPMSVPHLDTRMIEGKRELLFGPYAGFSTKFLKSGSYLDLPGSIQLNNLRPMIMAGLKNIPLTKYLIQQVRQSPQDRVAALREYLPEARPEDWELAIAGQRVQVIKKDAKQGGVLEFGTEVVSAADGSIAALLGASPGASTAVSIMLHLIQKCFPQHSRTPEWQARFREMIPSFGQSLPDNPELVAQVRARTSAVLGLEPMVEQ
ncbi:malate:quinone oxidoreductase [Hymenobacter sp. BT186]|uniref:Probable malate:quinone oxidoreductase n=1 Tax=Hymenobacter telluris TaxID=2816474 RepID=A0A939ES78_9BACT|nr:malate:quinone oxidoreductase [Hymenobacter telluris]MBO0356386.1 malate:quinone oxidoreductase [Hymenobacter telluris]MBW3372410.1 malate:quinone oxidoreductase [Hymenobacter norwichensis]